MRNMEVLEALGDPDFQTELGRFNLEINVAPKRLPEHGVTAFGEGVRNSLNAAEEAANKVGAHLVMIGILPTLTEEHLTREVLSANPRYQLLSDEILAARGEDIVLDIRGPGAAAGHRGLDRPGGGLHQHPAPRAGQPGGLRGVLERLPGDRQPAAGGRRELAVPAGQGAVARDPHRAVRAGHRHPRRGAQGPGRAPARVVRRAVDHLDLRPVRGERPLLPGAAAGALRRGPGRRPRRRRHAARWTSCGCTTARSTAGTGPIYAVVDGVPHVRVENRVLPAGPTVVDTMANAAFYFGLVRALAEQDRPVWSQMSFPAAEENFHAAAQAGIDAQVYWPGRRPGAGERARRTPAAAAGRHRASSAGASPARRRASCSASSSSAASPGATAPPGSSTRSTPASGEGDRHEVLRRVLGDYRQRMHDNTPGAHLGVTHG